MSLRTKTIEELLEMEAELRLSLDEEDGSYGSIIATYEELYKKFLVDSGRDW